MKQLIFRSLIVVGFGASVTLMDCGSSTNLGTPSDGGLVINGDGSNIVLTPPLNHFPAGATCRSTRPPGINSDDGGKTCDPDAGTFCGCGSDSECTAGTNGRCIVNGNAGPHCTYDECASSADCTAANTSCACGDIDPSSNNVCVPSNCKVDTDCGANGYCSPSYGSCGTYGGEYGGIYCHTANDQCTNDTDCTDAGSGAVSGGPGYCAFDTEAAKWTCQYTRCAG